MICRTTARATPLRRCAEAVRIDLISPCCGSSSFNAPQPSSSPFSETLQKVMSGLRKPSIGSACALSGGECTNMLARCSFNNSAISGRLRSSVSMCTSDSHCAQLPTSRLLSSARNAAAVYINPVANHIEPNHEKISGHLHPSRRGRPKDMYAPVAPGHILVLQLGRRSHPIPSLCEKTNLSNPARLILAYSLLSFSSRSAH